VLAAETGAPVVPVAHNAGRVWPKNSFVKHPGTVTVSIGPTIETRERAAADVIREVEDARDLLAQFDQLELADTIIRDRKVYRDALLSGHSVIELDNAQARAEMQLLGQEFFEVE
jgi:1-acyl-sn-glycerol-3-phosphate acyltransferase